MAVITVTNTCCKCWKRDLCPLYGEEEVGCLLFEGEDKRIMESFANRILRESSLV